VPWRYCRATQSTMTPDPDIWHAAAMLIQRHGALNAALVAAQRADEFLATGDEEGHVVWKAIVEAVLELLRAAPKEDEKVN
jgi:hypothetical protein